MDILEMRQEIENELTTQFPIRERLDEIFRLNAKEMGRKDWAEPSERKKERVDLILKLNESTNICSVLELLCDREMKRFKETAPNGRRITFQKLITSKG